jgi:hypothetical protein
MDIRWSNMKVIYRISDAGYNKVKLPHATKKYCLENFLTQWKVPEVTVLKDRCSPDTESMVK